MQKHWDVMRSDDAGEILARDQRQPAERFRLSHRRARPRAGDGLRRPDQERLGTLSPRWQAARVPQPDRRERMGSAYQRPAAKQLLRQRIAQRIGGRYARPVRRVFRHHRRAGIRLGRFRRQLDAHRPGSSRRVVGRGAGAAMIRVVLPMHLRKLANVDREVEIQVEDSPTIEAVLDALEARYPMLRGTIRDHVTKQRRPFIRFFACGEDLSLEPTDIPLPLEVVRGEKPLLIVGAMAGG